MNKMISFTDIEVTTDIELCLEDVLDAIIDKCSPVEILSRLNERDVFEFILSKNTAQSLVDSFLYDHDKEELFDVLKKEFAEDVPYITGLIFSDINEHDVCTVTNEGRTVGYIHLVCSSGVYNASYAPPQGDVLFFSSHSLTTIQILLANVHDALERVAKQGK